MDDQFPTLASLSSIFQFAAGVSLAMSVFRAPFERLYHRLGSILDREEVLLRGHKGDGAELQSERVLNARISWLNKGKELAPIIQRLERWIWASVLISSHGLVAASLWPSLPLLRWQAAGLVALALGPLLIGVVSINLTVHRKLDAARIEIERL